MQRRDALRTGVGALTVPLLGGVAAADDGADGGSTYEPLGEVSIPGNTMEIVTDETGEVAYAATGDGLATVDISDPQNPSVMARKSNVMRSVKDVKYENKRAVIASDAGNGLVVYDVSDPANPEEWATVDTPTAVHNCQISAGHVYITSRESGAPCVIYDVDCDQAQEVARWSPPGGARILHDIWVGDGRLYTAHWGSGTYIVDVSDPSNPEMIGETPNRADSDHFVMPNEDHSVMIVGQEIFPDRGPVHLWDISDPANPSHRSTIQPPDLGGERTTAHNCDLRNGRLYSSWYKGGVKVHDVSDPANPTLRTEWADSGGGYEFWTAKVGRFDEFFVGSNYGSGLVTFPDEQGQNAPDPGDSADEGDMGLFGDGGEAAAEPNEADAETDSEGSTGSSRIGLGAGLAATGIGIGTLRTLARRRDDEE